MIRKERLIRITNLWMASSSCKFLFPEECRPTMRWLRDQQKARRIPFVKIGRLVFFCPAQVRAALEQNSSFYPRTARAA